MLLRISKFSFLALVASLAVGLIGWTAVSAGAEGTKAPACVCKCGCEKSGVCDCAKQGVECPCDCGCAQSGTCDCAKLAVCPCDCGCAKGVACDCAKKDVVCKCDCGCAKDGLCKCAIKEGGKHCCSRKASPS